MNDFFDDEELEQSNHMPETPEEEETENIMDDFDFDNSADSIDDIDFSEFSGDFRNGMKKINRSLTKKKMAKRPIKNIPVENKATLYGKKPRKMERVIVPRDRQVIVEGVNNFILSKDPAVDNAKNIGYYKGKKLKELLIQFFNDSPNDFEIELFNPSTPLDYLHSTSQNLNNRIKIAGDGVDGITYTDVLFNLLANPTFIPNAKFTVAGPSLVEQRNQGLMFINKGIDGKQVTLPYPMSLQLDNMQHQNDILYFDIMDGLNRPFIPDGMDVVRYKVLAGMSVLFCFYYEQKSLKKFFFKEAAQSKKLM